MMKKLFLIFSLLISVSVTFAQKQKLKNLPYIDQRRFHYGFALGINFANVTFENAGKGWYAECPDINTAFCVGLIGDLALTENLSLRCQPTLYFVSRNVVFHHQMLCQIVNQDLKSCNLEIPLSIKVATKRLNNYRPYLLAGSSVMYDMSKDKETPILFKNFDFGLHIALGSDTYLPFFKFCPELRFNIGLLDMIDHKRKGLKDETLMQYTDAVKSAHTKSISLILHFE